MIRICMMTSVHPPYDIRIFHKECRTLVSEGYEVVLIVPHSQDEIVEGVKIKAVPIPKNRIRRILFTGWEIYCLALSEKADVYHIHDPELLPYAQLLRLKKHKVIFDMHENLPLSILSKEWIVVKWRQFFSRFAYYVERILLTGLYVVFAETSYKKYYLKVKKSADVLNMPYINLVLSKDARVCSSLNQEFLVGYVGGVSALRGSLVTLKALSVVQRMGYNCSFHCIGTASTTHFAELKTMIETLELKNIFLYNHLPYKRAWEIIRRCNAGLAILQPIPNYYESYPTKLFEYMALGVPVIVSDFPLYKDIVEKRNVGLCVNPDSAKELADAIVYLIQNPSKARQMGTNGVSAIVEKYNWETESKILTEFYKEILS